MWRDADLANRQLAITYGGNHALDANQADATITAINLANHNPGILTVSQNLSIGSIVPNAHGVGVAARLPIDIAVGRTATLIGTPAAAADHGFDAVANTYTGLGNVELGGNDGGGNASTLVVQAGNTIRTVTAARNGEGILSFEGAGGATGDIGTNLLSLTRVSIGNGEAHLQGHVFATTTRLIHANSILKLAAGNTITGAVWNDTGAANKGVLTFEGAGIVTGDIGAADAAAPGDRSLATINIGNGAVTLDGDVWAQNTNLTHINSVLSVGDTKTITGNIVNSTAANNKGILNFVGEVDFNAGGILEFNGADGPAGKIIPHFFNSTIQNGANGTLNVNTSMLIANNVEIGQIDTINIGMVGGNVKALAINASAVGANLLNGTNINFMHANSTLGLFTREHDSTVTFPC